jgi:hypothetical protein
MPHQLPPTMTEGIRELLSHLTRTNPHFALWDLYKRSVNGDSAIDEWRHFLLEQLGPGSEEEIEFACAMAGLDKLLAVYREQAHPLPMLLFERICFLHCIRGPERMAQTRAILGTLTAELLVCTSV